MAETKVLVVDDEKNIRSVLAEALDGPELSVRSAVNGEDALQQLAAEGADVVLLDLKMPGMDGLDVLRRVRESWPDTRVLVITAHGTVPLVVEAMKLGAVEFIEKPFSPEEVREAVRKACA